MEISAALLQDHNQEFPRNISPQGPRCESVTEYSSQSQNSRVSTFRLPTRTIRDCTHDPLASGHSRPQNVTTRCRHAIPERRLVTGRMALRFRHHEHADIGAETGSHATFRDWDRCRHGGPNGVTHGTDWWSETYTSGILPDVISSSSAADGHTRRNRPSQRV